MRRAIQLRELGERSTEETARIMGISSAAVKARVFHGRRKLRRVLQRESAGMSEKQSASGKANGLSCHQLVCSFGD
jgi:DNA-directed RNA polymerase specialized sigma24 family protein